MTTVQEKTVANSSRDEQFITHEPQEKQEVTSSQDKVAKVEENEDSMVDSLAKQVSELDVGANNLTTQVQKQQQKKSTRGITKKQSSTTNIEKSEDTQVNVQPVTKSHHRQRRSTNKNNNGLTVPKSDFDFARSNAKFDKSGMMAGKEGERTPEQSEFYNKVSICFA